MQLTNKQLICCLSSNFLVMYYDQLAGSTAAEGSRPVEVVRVAPVYPLNPLTNRGSGACSPRQGPQGFDLGGHDILPPRSPGCITQYG